MTPTTKASIVVLAAATVMLRCWVSGQFAAEMRSQHSGSFEACQRHCHDLGPDCHFMHVTPSSSPTQKQCYIYGPPRCVEGWEYNAASGICYKLFQSTQVTFTEANETCNQMRPRARLLMAKSLPSNIILSATGGKTIWIGAFVDQAQMAPLWADGTPFNADWRSVPDALTAQSPDEVCVAIVNYRILDRLCNDNQNRFLSYADYYFCELV